MYRFNSIKYLTTTAIIMAVLFVISYLTSFIRITPQSTFQIADGLFLAIIYLIPGPLGLITGPTYAGIVDLVTGSFITIPISIIVRIIMFLIVEYLSKYLTYYISFLLASIMIIIFYVPYKYFLFGSALAIAELITDAIQTGTCYFIAILLFFIFKKINNKNILWNDYDFNYYKEKKLQRK